MEGAESAFTQEASGHCRRATRSLLGTDIPYPSCFGASSKHHCNATVTHSLTRNEHPSMAAVGRPLSQSPFQGEPHPFGRNTIKSIPILPSAAADTARGGEAMDVNQHQPALASSMAPPALSSPNGDRPPEHHAQPGGDQQQQQQHLTTNGGPPQPIGAAAAAQQPKVIQTAFIHKLYKSVSPSHDRARLLMHL